MSGVVLEHRSELMLRHVISDLSPANVEFVPEQDVELATDINLGGLLMPIYPTRSDSLLKISCSM
jgi:hypothetical protein